MEIEQANVKCVKFAKIEQKKWGTHTHTHSHKNVIFLGPDTHPGSGYCASGGCQRAYQKKWLQSLPHLLICPQTCPNWESTL